MFIVVWGQAAQTYVENIPILQKRALRFIHFTSYRAHTIPLFIQSHIFPVNLLYFKTTTQHLNPVYLFKYSTSLLHQIFI